METKIMIKADKSRATKTGHFYLSLTVLIIINWKFFNQISNELYAK